MWFVLQIGQQIKKTLKTQNLTFEVLIFFNLKT